MGFTADYWKRHYIQNAIGSFGKLLHWRDDNSNLTRMIIKARVLDLQSVPQFLVYSETQGLESDSSTVQCEVLQSRLLGGGPPDEVLVPNLPLGLGIPFDFFGLGQPDTGFGQNHEGEDEHNPEDGREQPKHEHPDQQQHQQLGA